MLSAPNFRRVTFDLSTFSLFWMSSFLSLQSMIFISISVAVMTIGSFSNDDGDGKQNVT